MQAMFIVVEGVDKAGKSTVVIPQLTKLIKSSGGVPYVMQSFEYKDVKDVFLANIDNPVERAIISTYDKFVTLHQMMTLMASDHHDRTVVFILDRWVYSEMVYNEHYDTNQTVYNIINSIDKIPSIILHCHIKPETLQARLDNDDKVDILDMQAVENHTKIMQRYNRIFSEIENVVVPIACDDRMQTECQIKAFFDFYIKEQL